MQRLTLAKLLWLWRHDGITYADAMIVLVQEFGYNVDQAGTLLAVT